MSAFAKELNVQAKKYFKKWEVVSTAENLSQYKPSAIGWKTLNIKEFNTILGDLLSERCIRQVHIGQVDNRYIASIVFDKPIYGAIRILKLMQRRPDSKDAIGIDHVDFFVDNLATFENNLLDKTFGNWAKEKNEVHSWLSLRTNGIEAKFVDHIVLDVAISELQEIKPKLIEVISD